MQLRMEYSTTAERVIEEGGEGIGPVHTVTNEFLWIEAKIRPAYTPAATLDAIEDPQLKAIIDAIDNFSGVDNYNDVQAWYEMAYSNEWVGSLYPWITDAGVMPDGRHFANIDTDIFYMNRLDTWATTYMFAPDSLNLPPGYDPSWSDRAADVLAFKNGPAPKEFHLRNSAEYNGSFYAEVWNNGIFYLFGAPILQDFWLYTIEGDSLVASDDTLISTTAVEIGWWPFYEYRYQITGGAAQKFWTNFVSCVEDV